jgi:hypothetical protein
LHDAFRNLFRKRRIEGEPPFKGDPPLKAS